MEVIKQAVMGTPELDAKVSLEKNIEMGIRGILSHSGLPHHKPDRALFTCPSEHDLKFMASKDGKDPESLSLYQLVMLYFDMCVEARMKYEGYVSTEQAKINPQKIVRVFRDKRGKPFTLCVKKGYVCSRDISSKFEINTVVSDADKHE